MWKRKSQVEIETIENWRSRWESRFNPIIPSCWALGLAALTCGGQREPLDHWHWLREDMHHDLVNHH